jgi:integrase
VSQPFKHVTKRGDVFQYQRRVPKGVFDRPEAFDLYFRGQKLYRKSLRTSSYPEALARAAIAEVEFDGLVAAATGQIRATREPSVRPVRPLDAHALGGVSMRVRDLIVRDWRRTIVRAEVDTAAVEHLNARIENAIALEQDTGDPLLAITEGALPQEIARGLNGHEGFHLDEQSTGFAELVRAVSDGCVQAREDVQALLRGKALPDVPTSALIKEFSPPKPTSTAALFSVVARDHLKVSNFAPKTVEKATRAHQRFLDVVGDKPVDEISRQDIHRFLDAIAAQEVGAASGTARAVSKTTVQSYLTQISSRLLFAIGRGFRDGPNPAAGIDLRHWVAEADPVLVPAKRRFEIVELNDLFAHPWFHGCASSKDCYNPGKHLLDDMRYWAPVLALYTGARASELGGLKLSEIRLQGTPHISLQPNEYRRIKSGKPRVVPVLDALLELKFGEYVDRIAATGSDRLFPDWECPRPKTQTSTDELSRWANAKWIRAFNRTVVPAVFQRQPLAIRSPVTFHSFRGAFKKLLIDHGSEKKANAVVGHTQDELDRAYIGHFSADELHREFRAAEYSGIVIPRR